MKFRLVKSDFVPPKPLSLGDDVSKPRRRGDLSFGAHDKLHNKLYLRRDEDPEPTVVKLPSDAHRPEVSETGATFFTDKARKRVSMLDRASGATVPLLELDGPDTVWSLYATGDDVLWVWHHRGDVSSEELDTWIHTIERYANLGDGWRKTHTIDPGASARTWAATRDRLVVLEGSPYNASGTPTVYEVPASNSATALERVGHVQDWFDLALEYNGELWLRAYSEPAHSWHIAFVG